MRGGPSIARGGQNHRGGRRRGRGGNQDRGNLTIIHSIIYLFLTRTPVNKDRSRAVKNFIFLAQVRKNQINCLK